MCQCPQTRNYHFYNMRKHTKILRSYVSMPSDEQLSFLRNSGPLVVRRVYCVNALSRAITISTEYISFQYLDHERCQCPKSSNNHFYINLKEKTTGGIYCVNALSRAITISTVHSGNPLFTRLSRYVFVSNSQNILKINFFGLFFWLV